MSFKHFKPFVTGAWLSLALLNSSATIAASQNLYSFSSTSQEQRFVYLTKELRCLVCQNQSLADSDAPLAKDLRQKVYQLVLAGRSDAEIKHFLVSRYGEFILFSPPLKGTTLLLWGFPVFLLLGVVFGMCYHYRQQRYS